MTDLVAQVGVDAHELTTVNSSGALHVNSASAVSRAVTARAVDLAVVVGVEVDDVDVAAAVVLDDLVRGVVGTATDDVGCAITLDGDGILADVLKPDKLEGAGAEAVHTLALVGADDDVAQSGTILEHEDGVGLAALTLTTAGDATVVPGPAGVEDLAGLDITGLAEADGVCGSGNTALVAEAGHGRRQGGGKGKDSGRGVHLERLSGCCGGGGLQKKGHRSTDGELTSLYK